MYIRKKINKGGSYSVMLVTGERTPGRKNPTTRIIKNFGSSSEEKALENLVQQAEAYKKHLLSHSPKPKLLKIAADIDLKSCRSLNVGFTDVYGQCFDNVFHSTLPLKPAAMAQLRDLVVMRIAQPASKRKTAQLSSGYGIESKVDSIYKLMDKLNDKIITQIKQAVYQHTAQALEQKKETIDILFYDLTTISFETSSQDELRDFGFSKDGKHQHVKIMLAVSVTKNGLLVDYQEFPGNCYEGHTLLPVINNMKLRYEIDKIVLVADAALMNKINLQELTQKKYSVCLWCAQKLGQLKVVLPFTTTVKH
ncbi:MAG: transposase [Gammaproteobacteria bacterium]|nr:transposase [Gammaproteobacteria bacterium]